MFWKQKPKPKPQTLADRTQALRRAVRQAVVDATVPPVDLRTLVVIARELENAADEINRRLAMS